VLKTKLQLVLRSSYTRVVRVTTRVVRVLGTALSVILCCVQTGRQTSLRSMPTADHLPRAGGPDQRPRLPQRLFRVRPLQSSLHSGPAVRRRRRRQRLLPVGLPAPPARRHGAATRPRVDPRPTGDGRRWAGLDHGTRAAVPITTTERRRHGRFGLATARDVHAFFV